MIEATRFQGSRMSCWPRAARSCFALSSSRLTGTTTLQWRPTGQYWNLHQPNLSDFTEAAGIHNVVKR
jgi:hypothetical protein